MLRRPSLRTRLLAPLLGLLLLGAAVAGCGPARSAAAEVDGAVIGENELAAVVSELNELTYGQAAQLAEGGTEVTQEQIDAALLRPRAALSGLVVADTILDVASEAGVGVSAQQAEDLWYSRAAEFGLAAEGAELDDATITYIRSQLVVAGLASAPDGAAVVEEINARVAELDVTLSPRYGTWAGGEAVAVDPQSGGLVPGELIAAATPDWIVAPTEQA